MGAFWCGGYRGVKMKLKDLKGVYFEDTILICDKETVLARQNGYFSKDVINEFGEYDVESISLSYLEENCIDIYLNLYKE